MRSVDPNISDLFFNYDLSLAEIRDRDGKFEGYDPEQMADEAHSFLGCLARLSVEVPTVEELIADFHARI